MIASAVAKKRIRRGDHFVAGLDAQRQQAYMERRRSGTQRDAVARAAEIGIFALKGFDFLALRQMTNSGRRGRAPEEFHRAILHTRLSDRAGELSFRGPSQAIKTLLYREPGHKPGSEMPQRLPARATGVRFSSLSRPHRKPVEAGHQETDLRIIMVQLPFFNLWRTLRKLNSPLRDSQVGTATEDPWPSRLPLSERGGPSSREISRGVSFGACNLPR